LWEDTYFSETFAVFEDQGSSWQAWVVGAFYPVLVKNSGTPRKMLAKKAVRRVAQLFQQAKRLGTRLLFRQNWVVFLIRNFNI
jgi:hypothetical protein